MSRTRTGRRRLASTWLSARASRLKGLTSSSPGGPSSVGRSRSDRATGLQPISYIRLDESGGRAPEELREKGDTVAREIRRQFGATTDSSGHYSIRVGPGTYTLMGPPRTENEKITIKDEAELVRDFRMPRPEKGTLTGRVVLAGAKDTGVAGAKVEIAAANMMAIPFTVTADADGRFHAERTLDPLVICAKSPDGIAGSDRRDRRRGSRGLDRPLPDRDGHRPAPRRAGKAGREPEARMGPARLTSTRSRGCR